MTQVAQIDMTPVTVTPVFKYLDIEDVPQSEQKGYEVRKTIEVVEVHTAGSRNSVPVFPVDAMWKREGNRVITYAERWPEQYRAFKEGGPQNAVGTPLEMLRSYGITPEQISLCRVNKVYSIEALDSLSHDGIKALGVHANKLRDAARAFLTERKSDIDAASQIAELQAQIAKLRQQMAPEPIEEPTEEPTDEIAAMSDEQIKAEIKALAGQAPRGTPSRETLETTLRDLRQAATETVAA